MEKTVLTICFLLVLNIFMSASTASGMNLLPITSREKDFHRCLIQLQECNDIHKQTEASKILHTIIPLVEKCPQKEVARLLQITGAANETIFHMLPKYCSAIDDTQMAKLVERFFTHLSPVQKFQTLSIRNYAHSNNALIVALLNKKIMVVGTFLKNLEPTSKFELLQQAPVENVFYLAAISSEPDVLPILLENLSSEHVYQLLKTKTPQQTFFGWLSCDVACYAQKSDIAIKTILAKLPANRILELLKIKAEHEHTHSGDTPLHCAVRLLQLNSLKVLIESLPAPGVQKAYERLELLNMRNAQQQTPIMLARKLYKKHDSQSIIGKKLDIIIEYLENVAKKAEKSVFETVLQKQLIDTQVYLDE